MKVGAVLVTSILLVEEIIVKRVQAKNILKNFIRSNKYWQLEKERGKLASSYEFFNDYVTVCQ